MLVDACEDCFARFPHILDPLVSVTLFGEMYPCGKVLTQLVHSPKLALSYAHILSASHCRAHALSLFPIATICCRHAMSSAFVAVSPNAVNVTFEAKRLFVRANFITSCTIPANKHA